MGLLSKAMWLHSWKHHHKKLHLNLTLFYLTLHEKWSTLKMSFCENLRNNVWYLIKWWYYMCVNVAWKHVPESEQISWKFSQRVLMDLATVSWRTNQVSVVLPNLVDLNHCSPLQGSNIALGGTWACEIQQKHCKIRGLANDFMREVSIGTSSMSVF